MNIDRTELCPFHCRCQEAADKIERLELENQLLFDHIKGNDDDSDCCSIGLKRMTTRLEFRPEFWLLPLTWGRPDSVPSAICSCCSGALPDVPLILSDAKGWTLRLCDGCVDKWLGIAKS